MSDSNEKKLKDWFDKKLSSLEDDIKNLGFNSSAQEKAVDNLLKGIKDVGQIDPNNRSLITKYSGSDEKFTKQDAGDVKEELKQFGVTTEDLNHLANKQSPPLFAYGVNGNHSYNFNGSVGVTNCVTPSIETTGTSGWGGNVLITGGSTTSGTTGTIYPGILYPTETSPSMYPYTHIPSNEYMSQLQECWTHIFKLLTEKDELTKKITKLEFDQTQQIEIQKRLNDQISELKEKVLGKELTESDKKLLYHWQDKFGNDSQDIMKEIIIESKRINNLLVKDLDKKILSDKDECLYDLIREASGKDLSNEEIEKQLNNCSFSDSLDAVSHNQGCKSNISISPYNKTKIEDVKCKNTKAPTDCDLTPLGSCLFSAELLCDMINNSEKETETFWKIRENLGHYFILLSEAEQKVIKNFFVGKIMIAEYDRIVEYLEDRVTIHHRTNLNPDYFDISEVFNNHQHDSNDIAEYPIDKEDTIKPGDTVWTKSGNQGPLIVICEALTTHKFNTLIESGEKRVDAFICRDSKGKDTTVPVVDLTKIKPVIKQSKFVAWLPMLILITLMLSCFSYKAYKTPAITDFIKGKINEFSNNR